MLFHFFLCEVIDAVRFLSRWMWEKLVQDFLWISMSSPNLPHHIFAKMSVYKIIRILHSPLGCVLNLRIWVCSEEFPLCSLPINISLKTERHLCTRHHISLNLAINNPIIFIGTIWRCCLLLFSFAVLRGQAEKVKCCNPKNNIQLNMPYKERQRCFNVNIKARHNVHKYFHVCQKRLNFLEYIKIVFLDRLTEYNAKCRFKARRIDTFSNQI